MNNKGQTLIIFVILIPIIILMMAIVVDIGLLQHEVIKANGVVETALKDALEKNEPDLVQTYLEENEIPTENLKVVPSDHTIEVELSYSIEALFGQIVGLENYDVNVHLSATIENNEVVVTKKE